MPILAILYNSLFLTIENNWSFLDEQSIKTDFFKKNLNYFVFNGGDMEILFHKCKLGAVQKALTNRSTKIRLKE